MSKKSLIIPLVVLLAAAGLLFGIAGHLTGWQGNRPDQVTDDAYLRADMTPLSTRISGTVRKVNVNDYQSVKAGQILIELDDDDYRATLNQAQAALAASEASLADNQAAKRIQDAQIDAAKAGILQAEAAINAAKAGIASATPELDRAVTELHRQQALFDSKAATHQQLETATAQQGQLSGVVEGRKADLARAEGALATSQSQLEAAKRQREALNTKDDVYKADIAGEEGGYCRRPGKSGLHANRGTDRWDGRGAPGPRRPIGRSWNTSDRSGSERSLGAGELQRDSTNQYASRRHSRCSDRYLPKPGISREGRATLSRQRFSVRTFAA